MMRQRLGIALLLAISLMLRSQPVSAIGGNATNGGAFMTKAAHDTGLREWVTLVAAGALLRGWPKHSSIALITVYAPGADSGHVIVRETVASDGKRSLLFNAPASLAQQTLRMTVYVKHHSKSLVLLADEEGRWKLRRPQSMRVASAGGHGASPDHLLAFSVEGFGVYWLLGGDISGESRTVSTFQETAASSLVGGGLSRGVLPWLCSGLLLLAGWAMSRFIHRIEQRTGK
jgi:hypothetical protein